jgi:hypothetical protein
VSDSWHQVKYQKQLPYTVKDLDTNCPVVAKAKIDAWRAEADARSLHVQRIAHKRAINVLETEPKGLGAWIDKSIPAENFFGTNRYVTPERFKPSKQSILTRIYNWFLDLNITY